MEVYDEDNAVEFIKKQLASNPDRTTKYTSDDILEVIDIIWDYYEDNGFLDIDMSLDSASDAEENADRDVLVAHVEKMIKKDKGSRIKIEDVADIVDAELSYERLCDE